MEKLVQILDSASDSDMKGAVAQVWLKKYLDLSSKGAQEEQSTGNPSSHDKLMTLPERIAMLTYDDMAHIIQQACDEERWAEPDFQKSLNNFNLDLLGRLEEQVVLIENTQDLAPAFSSTLHSLYTAYDVGRMVLKFSKYLSQRGLRVHETQVEANKKAVEAAGRILQAVADKCAITKKELDESGWIDNVFNSVLQGDQDGAAERSEASVSVVEILRGLVDENFLEEWAGQLVESWRDSVIGLSHLKALPKV
jgi:N-terminal acetyltransferase B complex non-catalytic subunit